VVIGAAFIGVVQALVKDIITPIIGIFGKIPDFSSLFFTVNSSKFLIGDFINVVLSFLLLAAIIYYLVVMPVNRLRHHCHSLATVGFGVACCCSGSFDGFRRMRTL